MAKRSAYRQDLDEALRRIVDRLAQLPEVEKAYLFGSSASGLRDLFTDLDLVVVMESDSSFIQRSAELRPRLEAGMDLDLLVYTPKEFESMATQGFLRYALEGARVIYEKNPA